MNIPVAKKDLLHRPGVALDVAEERYGVPDLMTGRDVAKSQLAAASHPLQPAEDARAIESIRQELALAKRICGGQLSQQLAMEMQACAQVGRFQCPIPSSRCMLDTLMGFDDFVTVEDTFKNSDNIEDTMDMTPMNALKHC